MELTPDQAFASAQYSSRAADYVASAVHAGGADLDQIETLIAGLRPARLLDLGCGGGHVSYRTAPHAGAVVACDPTEAMLEAVLATAAARGLGNVSVRRAAAESLPFETGAFDAVISRYSTHHWQDMEAGLREAARVLAPGGTAIFVDSVCPRARLLDTHLQAIELLRDPSHVRNYSEAEWLAALWRAGLAPRGQTTRRVRIEFASWIARTRTPGREAGAIRALQDAAPASVREHFAVGADGSFDLEVMTVVADRP